MIIPIAISVVVAQSSRNFLFRFPREGRGGMVLGGTTHSFPERRDSGAVGRVLAIWNRFGVRYAGVNS